MNMNEETTQSWTCGSGKTFTAKPASTLYEFYLSGDIKDPETYIDWFELIRNAGKHDFIKIHINSYGGDLFTAIQMIRVLGESEATVICSVEGACMSAATMVFLCGDMFEVSDHSMFMFHNYSGGAFGKGGEMIDQLVHERKWSENLLTKLYKNFLTEEEIKSMLDNKDIWMDGDEVIQRLQKLSEAVNQEIQDPSPAKKRASRKKKT